MNAEKYPIIEIKPGWVLDREAMGSKKKFWYRERNDTDPWLFKYPQENKHTHELAGQHWAEKIAEQAAALMETRHATVELAVFQGCLGSATKSFANEGRILFHGNEMLAGVDATYDSHAKFKHGNHTLMNIFRAFDRMLKGEAFIQQSKGIFAEYLILDALIANTDRHHENWGFLRRQTVTGWRGLLAPSFDHASSLGRELQDKLREQIIRERRVGNYVNKGHGGIYWSADEKKAPSPLELAGRAVQAHPEFFRPALAKLRKFDESSLARIIERVPDGWMSDSARRFAHALMCYNQQQLSHLLS
jgi:hypothetical protein